MKNSTNNNSETYTWKRPNVVADDIASKLIQQVKKILGLFPLAVILCYLTYLYLKIVLPDEFLSKDKLFPCFMIMLSIFFYPLFIVLLIRWYKGSYTVNNEKISSLCPEKNSRIYSWKHIKGYWIENSKQFPDLKCIHIKTRSRISKVWLPEDIQEHPKILEFFEKYSVIIEPCYQEDVFSFTKKQLWFCWSFTIVITVILAALFELLPLQKHFRTFLLIVMLVPAIPMMLILGKKFYKDKRFLYAFILSMASFMLFMSIVVIAELYKYHKIIEKN
jgi:hypothetical protein